MESFGLYATSVETMAVVGVPAKATHFDQDLIGDTGALLNHFYSSGQMWAMLIGVVLGYGFKSMSSYG